MICFSCVGACQVCATTKGFSPSEQLDKPACLLKGRRERLNETPLIKWQENPNFSHFKHAQTQQPLDIHGCLDTSWVQEQLSEKKLLPTQAEEKPEENGGLCLEKTKKKIETTGVNGWNGELLDENTATYTRDDDAGVAPIITALKFSTKQRDLQRGRRIHADITRTGLLERYVIVGNSLVNLYAKCGALKEAQGVFDSLVAPNVISWTALIAGYAQHGQAEAAWNVFRQMQKEGEVSPNLVTFVCVLKACHIAGDARIGLLLHAQIVADGSFDEDVQVGTALMDMYAKCGHLKEAQAVFDELRVRDVVAWTTLIIGYAQYGHGQKALCLFDRMQDEGFLPNEITFTCALKACGGIAASYKCQQLHAQIIKVCVNEENTVISNALIDMYAKCGALIRAQEVFDNLYVRNEVSWTALIAGYAQQGLGEKALQNFKQMQHQGFFPNEVTLVCILTACGSIGDLDKGHEIHARILRGVLLDDNIVVANALIDMYANCGCFENAHRVVEQLRERDMVTWNALISGYVQDGRDDEAFGCLELMRCDGFGQDAVTFVCLLKACGGLGAADKGQQLHMEIEKKGLMGTNSMIVVSLVDMYAKCAKLSESQIIFDKFSVHDVISWNALMAGYAQLGEDDTVFCLLDHMLREGRRPDTVTFSIVLNTCCHIGLLDKGQMYFTSMYEAYGIMPTLGHHTCVIDLFGRAGHLDKVVAIVKEMSFLPDFATWHTLLSACQIWGNSKLGRAAFDRSSQIDACHTSAFVCLSNIFAVAGWQEDVYTA